MICHKAKLLYLHPAKTGGTSVETAMWKREIGHDQPTENQKMMYAAWTPDAKQHWPYAKLVREFPFLVDWPSVATVRHPYNRMISEFRYQIAGNRKKGHSEAHTSKDINKAIQDGSLWELAWAWHMAPMAQYVAPETTIVRLENLQEEWGALKLGELKHQNRSKERIEIKLNPASKRKITDRYKMDFDLLGYEP